MDSIQQRSQRISLGIDLNQIVVIDRRQSLHRVVRDIGNALSSQFVQSSKGLFGFIAMIITLSQNQLQFSASQAGKQVLSRQSFGIDRQRETHISFLFGEKIVKPAGTRSVFQIIF